MQFITKPATGPFTSIERTIITVPQMQGNLSATPDQIGWVITAFVVATAVGTILTGWFSQRFGRKVVFLAAIAGFTITSLMCAFADGLTELVIYRAMQGFISAPLLPVAQSIMLDTYPRERHGFAMSIWSMGMILGPVVDRGERPGWFPSTEIVAEAGLAALCLYIFVAHCLTARNPYLKLAMFKDRNFVIGLLLIFAFGVAVFASLFILPLFMQNIQGYPVMTAGWVVSARGVGTMIAMLSGGILADRFSGKYLILTGLLTVAGSNAWMTTWTAEVSMTEIVYLTVVNGFGMGIMWVSLATVTFSTLDSRLRVEAASLFALVRAIGASMGTSAIVTTLTRSSQTNYVELRAQINPFSEAFQGLGAAPWNLETAVGLAALRNLVADEAQMIAFLNDFRLLVIVVIIPMPLVFLLRKSAAK